MSDSPFPKLDWFDLVKGGATAIATAVVGVLVRLLFGRAMKGIDDALARLEKSNADQSGELKELRAELADCRAGILVLQTEIENLKAIPVPVGTPR